MNHQQVLEQHKDDSSLECVDNGTAKTQQNITEHKLT